MSVIWTPEAQAYADSLFAIGGRPLIRFSGRNSVEFIFLCISIAGIPLTLSTIFVIITKTPPQLKKYQWILLNLVVTVFITDITICFLFDPLPVFPEIACYSESWLANVSENANYVLFSVSIILLQFSFCGTLVAFIHRLNALQPLPGKLESLLPCNTHYITAAIYIFGNIPIIFVLISSYKLPEEMKAVVEKEPHLHFLNGYRSYLATVEDDPKFAQFQVVWLTTAFVVISLCGIVAGIIIIHLHKKRRFMSSKTMELHRDLMIHLIVQSLTPALSVLLPIIMLFSTRYFQVPFGAKFWNAVLSQTVALHSPINTIAVLVATKYYRNALYSLFEPILKKFHRKPVVDVTTTNRIGSTTIPCQFAIATFKSSS
ncbi:hypothetical protein V3C99_010218 [Haemonchus contortus]